MNYELRGLLKIGIARPFLQPVWRALYKLSLYGLGYRNTEKRLNGEVRFYQWLAASLGGSRNENPAVIFDVGARFGDVSSVFHQSGGGFRIHAFEPDPRNVARLQERFGEEITINEVAVAERSGNETLFYLPEKSQSHFSSLVGNTLNRGETGEAVLSRSVKAISLDDYVAEHGIEEVDFLKIDVEGAENRVLKGASNILQGRRVAWILLEISQATRVAGSCLREIASLAPDYQCYKILPSGLVRLPTDRPLVEWSLTEYANFVFRRPSL